MKLVEGFDSNYRYVLVAARRANFRMALRRWCSRIHTRRAVLPKRK